MWLLLATLFSGCSSFSGDISFRNESPKEVWVERVEGFEYQPPVGILIPGAYIGSSMGSMKFPEEIVLLWSGEWHKADQRSVISLKGLAPPTPEKEIQFIFTSERVWTAKWKDEK